MTRPVIGFIGAGQLGEPAAERLLEEGWAVNVHARREEVRDRLRRRGAVIAETVRQAARVADVLVLFVFSDDQVRETMLGDEGAIGAMRPGSVLAVHTTTTPQTLRALDEAAARAGVSVVDAPVSGTAADIREGRLTVLLGGGPEAVERCGPVVGAYADPVFVMGDLGTAMKAKLINNVLFAAHVQLAAEAARLAERLGLDPARTLRALLPCSGASAALGYMTREEDQVAFAVGIGPYLRKDVQSCEAAARELSVDLGLLEDVARRGPLDIV